MEKNNFTNPLARIMAGIIDSIIYGVPYLVAAFTTAKIISIIFLIITFAVVFYNRFYLLVKKRASLGMQLMEIKMFRYKKEQLVQDALPYSYVISRDIIGGLIFRISYGI